MRIQIIIDALSNYLDDLDAYIVAFNTFLLSRSRFRSLGPFEGTTLGLGRVGEMCSSTGAFIFSVSIPQMLRFNVIA
jgi:hypothetical protein